MQEFSKLQGWTVNFSVENDLDQVVIKVMDAETKSMIRQIPSEELLAISKRIRICVRVMYPAAVRGSGCCSITRSDTKN